MTGIKNPRLLKTVRGVLWGLKRACRAIQADNALSLFCHMWLKNSGTAADFWTSLTHSKTEDASPGVRQWTKKIPGLLGSGSKIPSLRWIRESQTLPEGDAEASRRSIVCLPLWLQMPLLARGHKTLCPHYFMVKQGKHYPRLIQQLSNAIRST